MGDPTGNADHDCDRWQLGFWLRRQRSRHALHDRQSEEAECRGRDCATAEPHRPAGELSSGRGGRRHDRDDHRRFGPFGGAKSRLGTNPICFAIPSNLEGPFVFDMATSAAAAGKINVATARGEQVPAGWLIDAEGRPSTDPKVLRAGGALLPLGGTEGYKGTGLAAIVEILSGLLTGLGFGIDPQGRHNDGCFMAVFNVAAFRDLATFKAEVTDFAKYLKATPPAEGFSEIFYPGEVEFNKERDRRKNGVPIEDATWKRLGDLAATYGIADKLGF